MIAFQMHIMILKIVVNVLYIEELMVLVPIMPEALAFALGAHHGLPLARYELCFDLTSSLHIPLQYWKPNEGPLLSFVDFFNYSSLQKDSLVSFSKFSFFKMNYKTMTANNTYQKSTQNVLFLNRKSHWKSLVRFKHFIDSQQKQWFSIDIWQKWHPFLFAFIDHVLKLVNTFK